MAKGYLNSFSFPARSLQESLEFLRCLQSGIASLIKKGVLTLPVICSVRASNLALSPDYELLSNGMSLEKGRFRDTILFYLKTLDQQTPADSALEPELKAEMDPHVVGELVSKFDPDAASAVVACALDNGILLSLGADQRWRSDRVEFKLMTATSQDEESKALDNIHDVDSADKVGARHLEILTSHKFENWAVVTGGASKSEQLDVWFASCTSRPGLEQLIMRSVQMAMTNDYRIDGDLIKKLGASGDLTILEIRAFYNGSNNVRLLFSRDNSGNAIYGYGGIKSNTDWYDTAIAQAEKNIKELIDKR